MPGLLEPIFSTVELLGYGPGVPVAARGFSWSCSSDVSWLSLLSFLPEGSVKMIFSHRCVIGGQT